MNVYTFSARLTYLDEQLFKEILQNITTTGYRKKNNKITRKRIARRIERAKKRAGL